MLHMKQKLLTNKKKVIAVVALFLVLCVGIILVITLGSKESGKKDGGFKTEQTEQGSKDEDVQEDENKAEANDEVNDKGNNNSGLEVLKPDEIAPENSSDASGSWDDTQESDTDAEDETNDQTENNDQGDEEEEKDEDILEDDITWGNVY